MPLIRRFAPPSPKGGRDKMLKSTPRERVKIDKAFPLLGEGVSEADG